MAIDQVETKAQDDVHVEKAITPVDDERALDEKALAAQYKAAAIEGENAEHDMGVPQAVKEYPMAALWAFIMSCTIVSCLHYVLLWQENAVNTIHRSWKRTACS